MLPFKEGQFTQLVIIFVIKLFASLSTEIQGIFRDKSYKYLIMVWLNIYSQPYIITTYMVNW